MFNCPFCTVGNNFGEYRDFKLESVKKSILDNNIHKIGLVSANAADYYALDELLLSIPDDYNISFSSLRLDTISDKLINSHFFKNQRSITIGLESG
jgi:radical SAM superfamily enzyme YgiQ (UPF0313 family)